MGLWYPKDTGFNLIAFLDSDHAGCLDTRKSTSGGIQFLGGDKLISWSSKKQDCTSMSTAEAEYDASADQSSTRCMNEMVVPDVDSKPLEELRVYEIFKGNVHKRVVSGLTKTCGLAIVAFKGLSEHTWKMRHQCQGCSGAATAPSTLNTVETLQRQKRDAKSFDARLIRFVYVAAPMLSNVTASFQASPTLSNPELMSSDTSTIVKNSVETGSLTSKTKGKEYVLVDISLGSFN
ncbi:hypothetical protein Tco_0110701 [Tanacetum coccineum]